MRKVSYECDVCGSEITINKLVIVKLIVSNGNNQEQYNIERDVCEVCKEKIETEFRRKQ